MPLNRKVTEKAKDKVCAKAAAPAPKRPLTEMHLAEMERTHVQRILDATGWHKGRAANWIYSFGRFLDIIQSLANIGGPNTCRFRFASSAKFFSTVSLADTKY